MTDRQNQEAFEIAIRLLTPREHSELELHQKLRKRNVADDVIGVVVKRLKELGYLSNERYAETYVMQRTRKGDGPLKITANLRRRGISDDLIASYLPKEDDYWLNEAQKVLVKRFGQVDHANARSRSAWKKHYTFLSGRGFPSAVIRTLLQ